MRGLTCVGASRKKRGGLLTEKSPAPRMFSDLSVRPLFPSEMRVPAALDSKTLSSRRMESKVKLPGWLGRPAFPASVQGGLLSLHYSFLSCSVSHLSKLLAKLTFFRLTVLFFLWSFPYFKRNLNCILVLETFSFLVV